MKDRKEKSKIFKNCHKLKHLKYKLSVRDDHMESSMKQMAHKMENRSGMATIGNKKIAKKLKDKATKTCWTEVECRKLKDISAFKEILRQGKYTYGLASWGDSDDDDYSYEDGESH